MKFTVYHAEILFIIAVLVLPLCFSETIRTTEWIATAAVFFTFLHAQMGNKMQEADAAKTKPAVKHSAMIIVYQILKEGLWVVFFFMTHAWAALLGAVVFFCYPFWRTWYRNKHPLKKTA